MVINMFVVDRVEDNYVILEHNKKFIEVEKDKLPDVKEHDVLYFVNNKYIKDNKKRERIKRDIRDRFNKLKDRY